MKEHSGDNKTHLMNKRKVETETAEGAMSPGKSPTSTVSPGKQVWRQEEEGNVKASLPQNFSTCE